MGITSYMYPGVVTKLFGFQKEEVKRWCKPSWALFLSCVLGNLGHILLDVTMHAVNPIFWPWIDPENVMGPLVILFGGKVDVDQEFLWARIASHLVMGILCMVIILQKRQRRWEYLLLGAHSEYFSKKTNFKKDKKDEKDEKEYRDKGVKIFKSYS